MKNKIIKGLIAFIMLILPFQSVFAQWNQQSSGSNHWYRLDTAAIHFNSVGVGNFTTPNSPLSALHVNTNLLATSTVFTKGEVFRTSSDSTFLAAWRLFTGSNNGTERFSLIVPVKSNHVFLSAVQNGRFYFRTNSFVRMLIDSGSTNQTSNGGRIAMGDNLSIAFKPTARLHLHETDLNGGGAPYIRFTAQFTGVTATDGYEMGIDSVGDAQFKNFEPYPITFFTNNGGSTVAPRMTIQDSTGYVGINTTSPTNTIEVAGTAKVDTMVQSLTDTMVVVTTGQGGVLHTKPASSFGLTPCNLTPVAGTIPIWNGGSLCNSLITEADTNVFIGSFFARTSRVEIDNSSVALEVHVNNLNNILSPLVGTNTQGINVDVEGHSNNPLTGVTNYGIMTRGHSSELLSENYGIYSQANDGAKNCAGFFNGYGGYTINYGVFGTAHAAITNYSIYGNCNISIYDTLPNDWAGWFQGKMNVNGHAYCLGGVWSGSDQNIKENIVNLSNDLGLATVRQLQPRRFNFKTTEFPFLGMDAGVQEGLIAQEVSALLPELVKDVNYAELKDSAGNTLAPAMTIKHLNYVGLIPYALAAIKDLDSINTANTGNYVLKSGDVMTGSLGIGAPIDSLYRLSVCGNIHAKKVVIESNWCDYVFLKDYKLKPLSEVEHYIKTNGHLEGFQTQKEIETKGADVGNLLSLQQKKIEELTLYIIELQKRLEKLEKKN